MNPLGTDANDRVIRRSRMSLALAQLPPYGLAVLAVGGAVGLLLVFERFGLRPPTGMVMCLSVAIISWYGQRGPALLSLCLALLSMGFFFTEPKYHFFIASSQIPYYVVFASLATLIWWFSTVRRRIESDLRQARDRLNVEVEERSSLLDLTHDAIFVRNMDAVITYWNRGAEDFYGWPRQKAVGSRSHDVLRTQFPKPIERIMAELLETDRWEGELEHTTAHGAQVVVSSRWSLRRDDRNRPVAVLETSNDITARKRREEEIQDLNRELARRSMALEASNKELEAFAYSVSHDLRAPLRHLAGFGELLQKSTAASLDEKAQRYLNIILEAAARMGNLIDDLLAFSRVGRAEAHISVVSLEQLVQDAMSEVCQDAARREIAWQIHPLPSCYGDRSMLRVAMVNLMSNAVKFTRTRARAEIEVGCTKQDDDGLVLFVKDNGVGFDMKYSNKLFGVFQRLHREEDFEGTGIGLAIVQRIAQRHHGRAWAEGSVDGGATFYLSLSGTKEK